MLLLAGLTLAATTLDAGRCRAAIERASAAELAAIARAVGRCEAAVGRGRLPLSTTCRDDAAVARVRATAAARATTAIGRRCCGGDHRCGTADDPSASDLGWPDQCPDIDDGGCGGPLTLASDVVTCATCRAGAAGIAAAVRPGAAPGPTDTPTRRCLAGVASARAAGAARGARAAVACRSSGGAACDGRQARIAAAIRAPVCRACGGADGHCGGDDDVEVGALGLGDACLPAPLGDQTTCAGALAALADVPTCLSCLAERVVECAATPPPAQASSCDLSRPACGTGVVCGSALDCPVGYSCLDNGAGGTTRFCVGPECHDDAGCAGGGACRQYCTRDGFTVTCGTRRCQCPGFGCAGTDELCIDTGGLACRKVCLQDSDCVAPFGFVCVNPGFGFGLCIGNLPCQ